MRATNGKKIHRNGLIGQAGVNLIERVAIEMGCIWNQSGGLEAGIDGYIELRDAKTGAMFNSIVQVQSKAVDRAFTVETATGFEFLCDERDLDYWLGGNAPVILVVSRPASGEAYWVSIKEYFRDPTVRKARKVRFDKARDRFDAGARDALFRLALAEGTGLYLTPVPREETLYSNLLPVVACAARIFVADTEYRLSGPLVAAFRERDLYPRREWFLKEGKIFSFHDLAEPPWSDICDRGTVEDFDSREWSDADDPDLRRDFARLLGRALSEKTGREMRYERDQGYYHFKAPRDRLTRTFEYRNLRSTARRTVVKAYPSKRDPERIAHWRHAAFAGRFKRLDADWYLEIIPTYHFTVDGWQTHPFGGELLAGIKRLEHNQNVLSQVLMWGAYLTRPGDLFTPTYPFLTLGPPLTFAVAAGLDDALWLPQEEEGAVPDGANWLYDTPLFTLDEG